MVWINKGNCYDKHKLDKEPQVGLVLGREMWLGLVSLRFLMRTVHAFAHVSCSLNRIVSFLSFGLCLLVMIPVLSVLLHDSVLKSCCCSNAAIDVLLGG